MPSLTYSSKKFDPPYTGIHFTGKNTVPVSWDELLWAAITVGKREFRYLFQHGIYSCYEMQMRIYMVQVNFKESAAAKSKPVRFQHTEVYKSLDPSEKNALSYFMGLTMAKLLSYRYLNVPWMIHLDRFKGRLTFDPGTNERPDLIGLDDSKEWVVMEAKGRTGNASLTLMEKAKDQTGALNKIRGKDPVVRVACAAYATPAGMLSAKWEDPTGAKEGSPDLDIGPEEFLAEYYAPIRNLISINNQGTVQEQSNAYRFITSPSFIETNRNMEQAEVDYRFTTAVLPDLDVRIGLLDGIEDLFLRHPNWYLAYTRKVKLNALQNVTEGNNNRRAFLGPDGVLIELGPSWNSENMQQEPNKRTY